MWIYNRGPGEFVRIFIPRCLNFTFQQCQLFHSIKPLFANKPTILVINKIDVTRLDDVHPDSRALVQEIIDQEGIQVVQVSCHSEEGVMELKNKACDALLAHRVDTKMRGTKVNSIINRIHVAQPKPRDDVARPAFIPDSVKERKMYDRDDPEKKRLLKDRELEEGGPGVFNINIRGAFASLIPFFVLSI